MGLGKLTASQRTGGLGDSFRGLARDKLLQPAAPMGVHLWDPFKFRRCVPGGKERGKGKDTSVIPRGRVQAGSFVLRVFISLLQTEI